MAARIRHRWETQGRSAIRKGEDVMIEVRAGAKDDLPFLWEMLYEAIFVPPGAERPDREILTLPSIAQYLDGFGRPGDQALVAVRHGVPVGAAWYRIFTRDRPGYGYVADDVPELSLAVGPSWRGQGVGTLLLTRLMEAARRAGWRALSLSVDVRNPARRLYDRLGFTTAVARDDALVMIRSLTDATP
jgi:ribosomal-protein-alanine N-acetyltransferase